MALLHSYIPNVVLHKAFTLFEVMVVIAIFSGVLSATLFTSTNMYQSEVLQTERMLIIQLLQTARSDAQTSQFGMAHGVAFNPDGFIGYVTFSGKTFTESLDETRQFVPSASAVVIAPGAPREVVFLPVSGDVHGSGMIRLTDRNRPLASTTISINDIGYVGW